MTKKQAKISDHLFYRLKKPNFQKYHITCQNNNNEFVFHSDIWNKILPNDLAAFSQTCNQYKDWTGKCLSRLFNYLNKISNSCRETH